MCSDLKPAPPEWSSIQLPPRHILRHLTDAHCHPTDSDHARDVMDGVELGGLAAMATADDQEQVAALGAAFPWPAAPAAPAAPAEADATDGAVVEGADAEVGKARAPRIVASFGYHPWFVHRFYLGDTPPDKAAHYRHVLAPREAQEDAFAAVLPHLPEPEPFAPRLHQLKAHVLAAQRAGRAVLVGEFGLDGAARVRLRPAHSPGELSGDAEWGHRNNLTPFKCNLSHQAAVARLQLDAAVELGVSASVHCVAASGATLELLQAARRAHGGGAFGHINVCIHSCGGMSPAFLAQAARVLPNAYFSPSVAVTARSPSAAAAVRAVPRERLLVESDAADARHMPRLVWAATQWIAACRGWRLEDGDTPDWELVLEEEDDEYLANGKVRVVPETEVWAVRTLERNWARFLGLLL